MNKRKIRQLAFIGLWVLILLSIIAALAAVNIVPTSLSTDYSTSLNVNTIKPAECVSINLENLVVCSGSATCNGTNSNDLILGSPIAETINGGVGNDCILGGGGADALDGGPHTDVCIGGPGTDTFARCETQIQ